MLSLHKLGRLPSSLGLRKTVKVFEEAERRLILQGFISDDEVQYLSDLLDFWVTNKQESLGKPLSRIQEILRQETTKNSAAGKAPACCSCTPATCSLSSTSRDYHALGVTTINENFFLLILFFCVTHFPQYKCTTKDDGAWIHETVVETVLALPLCTTFCPGPSHKGRRVE